VDQAGAATVCRVFDAFADIGSATKLLPVLHAEGLLTKTGRSFDKGAVYQLLVNRVYLGEAVHKGTSYRGEHAGIVPRELWDRVHATLQESPRERGAKNRANTPALLRGLLFGADGRAMTQVRSLLRQPEVIVGTWRAARAGMPDLTEAEVRDALGRLDPLWDELFPGEQDRIVRLLVERVTVGDAGAEIRLNLEGLAGLARDLAAKKEVMAA